MSPLFSGAALLYATLSIFHCRKSAVKLCIASSIFNHQIMAKTPDQQPIIDLTADDDKPDSASSPSITDREMQELEACAWVENDNGASTEFLADFPLEVLQQTLLTGFRHLYEQQDPKLEHWILRAQEINMDVSVDKIYESRDDDVWLCMHYGDDEERFEKDVGSINERERLVELLDALRKELVWVKAEARRLEMHVTINRDKFNLREVSSFTGNLERRSWFGYRVSPREVEKASA
jgi:hypothetical protein